MKKSFLFAVFGCIASMLMAVAFAAPPLVDPGGLQPARTDASVQQSIVKVAIQDVSPISLRSFSPASIALQPAATTEHPNQNGLAAREGVGFAVAPMVEGWDGCLYGCKKASFRT